MVDYNKYKVVQVTLEENSKDDTLFKKSELKSKRNNSL